MKNLLTIILAVLCIGGNAQTNPTDSLALVALYNNTGGTNWTNNTNWLSGQVDSWFGITVTTGRVDKIELPNNNLQGQVPTDISNMNLVQELILNNNQLTDLSDLSGMTALQRLIINDNALEALPSLGVSVLQELSCQNNRLEFDDLQAIFTAVINFNYSPQAPVGESGFVYAFENEPATLTVSTGGSGNTYSWYQDGTFISGPNVVPDYNIPAAMNMDEGFYVAEITNSSHPALTLESRPQRLMLYDTDSLGGQFVPNQMIVEFTDDATQFERDTLLDYYQAKRLDSCMCGVIELWELPDTSFLPEGDILIGLEETKQSASTKSKVEEVDNNYVLPLLDDNSKNNNKKAVKPTPASSRRYGRGPAPKVAIIDVGVDYNHPEFSNLIWDNPEETLDGTDEDNNCLADDIRGYDFAERDTDPADLINGHGTHLAGIITKDHSIGDLEIIPIKSHQDDGLGLLFEAVCGIYYARHQEANIINLSWGYRGVASTVLENAIRRAGENCGSLFITSAGNDSTNNDQFPHYPSSYELDNIISVAALDISESLLSETSNYGIASVDLAAPGTRILSTVPGGGFDFKDGTSMAAAAVSHAATKLWQARPDATYLTIKESILESVTELPALDSLATGGKLNLTEALSYIQTATIDTSCSMISKVFSPGGNRSSQQLQAFPQPFDEFVTIALKSAMATAGNLQVRNAMGQVVHTEEIKLSPGTNQWQLSTTNWPAGIYSAAIHTENGFLVIQLLKQ